MMSLPAIFLDLSVELLLKLGKINIIDFFHTETGNKGCHRGNFECGAIDISSKKPTFLQSQIRLNPQSAICISMNPRDVQQRYDTALVVS